MRRYALIFLLFLFGISSAWGDSTTISIAGSSAGEGWSNPDSVLLLDGKCAEYQTDGTEEPLQIYNYDFDITAGDTIDSVRVGLVYYDEDSDQPPIALSGGSGNELISDYSQINAATSLDTVWHLFTDAVTLAQANGYLGVWVYCDHPATDHYTRVDGAIIRVFSHTPEVACTLGITNVTVTQLNHTDVEYEIDTHCGVDSVLFVYDTSTAYRDTVKNTTSDTTFVNTAVGCFVWPNWYYMAIAWYGSAADTATGSWSQNWMVDTVVAIPLDGSAYNGDGKWRFTLTPTVDPLAAKDSFIANIGTAGYNDSSNTSGYRMAWASGKATWNNYVITTPDTAYFSVWCKRVVGGDTLWSPRATTFYSAYDSARIVAVMDNEITMEYWASWGIQPYDSLWILADSATNPPTSRLDSCASCSLVTADNLVSNTKYYTRAIIRDGTKKDTSAVDSATTSWADTSTAPYDLKITTFRSERDDSAGYGENSPDQLPAIAYVTWKPYLSAAIMQDSVVACSLNVGSFPAGATMWRAYREFSDTLFRYQRTPKIPYVSKSPSTGADTGNILQDNTRYWARIKTKHVNGTWGAWSADSGMSFTGIEPTQWWSANYSSRRNITTDTAHSMAPIDYTHEVVLPTGYAQKVAGNGLPNEAGNTFAALDGWLYFAWIGACTTSGWATDCGHYVRKYDYSNKAWTDSQWVGPVICEAHYSPKFMFDDRKILWYLQGPHYSKIRLMRTKHPSVAGLGVDLSDTNWFGGHGKTTYNSATGVFVDTSKGWYADSLIGWYVSRFHNGVETPMEITDNTDTSLITANTADSVYAGDNYYVYMLPDSSQTYYDTSGFWATYPYMYMPDSNLYIFARDRYHQDGMYDYYAYVHSTDYGVTWSRRKYIWINQPHAAASNSAYATMYNDGVSSRVWVMGSHWWCYGCDNQAARDVFLMYSDPDANMEYTKWYNVWGESIGVTQQDTAVTANTVCWTTVHSSNSHVITCEDPFGGASNDSAAGGGLLGASNDYGLTTINGSPIVSFAYFDSAMNYQPSFECVAKPDYDRQEWIIDNLSNRTKFMSRDTASHTAYWIKIVNGSVNGKKFIIHDGASAADTFDNITSTQMLRDSVNWGSDSSTFVKVLWVGMDLPANDSSNFHRVGTGTYSYVEFDAASLYPLWNFRNGGQIAKSGDNVYVYGFERPSGVQYYGGEATCWTGSNLDSAGTPTWSRTPMSANSGRGYGRFSPLPEPAIGVNRAVSFGRDTDVLVSTDIDFPGMLNNGNDIRIVKGTYNGSTVTWTQYPRLPDYFDQESTHVYFNLKTIWPANKTSLTNSVLMVYYGATADSSLNPPASEDTVFNFYESWEDYANEDTASKYNGWTRVSGAARVFCYFNRASGFAPQSYWTGYLHGGSNFMRLDIALNGYSTIYKSISRTNIQLEAYVSAIDANVRPFIRFQDAAGNYVSIGVDATLDSGCYNSSWDTTWHFGGQFETGQLGLQTLHHLKLIAYAVSADSVAFKGYINGNLILNTKRGNILNPISRIVLGSRKSTGDAGSVTFDGITMRRHVANTPIYTIRDVKTILGGGIRRLRYTKELLK